MNILYIITGLSLGGAEIVTINLANYFVKNGNNVMIMYLTGNNAHKTRINENIEVIGLKMAKNVYGFLSAQLEAHKIIKRFRPDVIHGNMVHANLFARLLRLHCCIPLLISTEHNKDIEGKLRMKLYWITDFLSDMNTNVSKEATEYFIKQKAFSPLKTQTVYNGIDLNRFIKNNISRKEIRTLYSINKEEFLFLNIGRLTPAKGQENLLMAFDIVHKKYANTKLIIIGEGKLKDRLQEKIQFLKLSNKVILAGAHQNIEDFYNAADCFVLSSEWEGFGLVLAEAMATELPVISTDSGGCAEVLNNTEFLTPTNNILALSSKMDVVYTMSIEQKRQLGIENRIQSSRFEINKIIQQWNEIYKRRNSPIVH